MGLLEEGAGTLGGALGGAGLGFSIGGPPGAAIGSVAGAGLGLLAGKNAEPAAGLPRVGKMRREYTKTLFDKMAKGELVSDKEKRAMQEAGAQQAQQVLQAQQRQLAQTARSGGAMGAQAGAVSKQIASAGTDAAVKAESEANRLAAALEEKRKASAMASLERQHEVNRANTERALAALSPEMAAEAATGIGKAIGGLLA